MGDIGFAEPDVRNVSERAGHAGLMLAARITLPHFSVSSAMSLLNQASFWHITSTLRPASRSGRRLD